VSDSPPITIAVPAYKPAFLKDALSSALNQTYINIELLISIDSPDSAVADIVGAFDDSRIRVLKGPRRGLAANSDFLWRTARTDLIKYLYDDDVLAPTCVEELKDALLAVDRAAYAFCRRHLIDSDGRITASPPLFESPHNKSWRCAVPAATILRTRINVLGEPTNLLIRRSSFPMQSPMSEIDGLPILHNVDLCLFINAPADRYVVGTPRFLSAFRAHEDQATQKTNAPAFVASIYEWEIFMRASLRRRLLPADMLCKALGGQIFKYEQNEHRFPILSRLKPGLHRLIGEIGRGERIDGLDAPFRAEIWRILEEIGANTEPNRSQHSRSVS
jgi:glycosyltransferase involved in cell wall biosynthesis